MKCLQGLFNKTAKSTNNLQALSTEELMAVFGGTNPNDPTPNRPNDTVPSPSPTTGIGG
ncbi:hypothetical protein ACUHMQ_16295 [Chitinimonas sp. PSY-7]|uniref:hypothetical protein n=1 Tax=Chitinimonas sp. PSY-7 TaxID=3459088 RepID=UPI00403FD475